MSAIVTKVHPVCTREASFRQLPFSALHGIARGCSAQV